MATSPMEALIQTYDICPNRARHVAAHQLKKFDIEDVRRILDQLQPLPNIKGSRNPCGPVFNRWTGLPIWFRGTLWFLVSTGAAFLFPIQLGATVYLIFRGRFRAIWKELPLPTIKLWNWRKEMVSFIKTPLRLIRKSIAKGQALCINRQGNFSLRERYYAVMSHVWGETMGWQSTTGFGPVDLSVRKMGMPMQHFLRFFDKCEEEWLWVDVIAMPEVLEDMRPAEKEEVERLRLGVINCLSSIYTMADKIVVIDTTLLRLSTRSPVDLAVALCVSLWMTRLWTYTEARMARQVVLKTRDSTFDLDDIIEFLDRTVLNDEHRYFGLLARLLPLRDHLPNFNRLQPSCILESACFGRQGRYAEVEADDARTLFPLLGLTWEYGWTYKDGLKKILERFPEHSEWVQKWAN